jgi:hypothetical protein
MTDYYTLKNREIFSDKNKFIVLSNGFGAVIKPGL